MRQQRYEKSPKEAGRRLCTVMHRNEFGTTATPYYFCNREKADTVFTMAKFTIPDDKCLVVELNEKNGGRHQSFVIENEDLVRANTINELQVR